VLLTLVALVVKNCAHCPPTLMLTRPPMVPRDT
jgi:hypothetical protein